MAQSIDPVSFAINSLRRSLFDEAEPYSAPSLGRLADSLEAHPVLRSHQASTVLAQDLRECPSGPRMVATKAHINSRIDNTVLSVFSAPYFPTLALDVFQYDEIVSDTVLAQRYPSPTVPVNMLDHSHGFGDRVVVALFPENHLDGGQLPHDLIFYFINKFTTRHHLTRRLIDAAMVHGSFGRLSASDDHDVSQAAASWVRLHEFHHRTGSMPIPEYLPAKSTKALAGLEEMRTDVKSMLVCLSDQDLDAELAAVTFEFILAERLLRYSVEGIPRPNYDAIASQLLFNYLLSRKAIGIRSGRIILEDGLVEGLQDLSDEIAAIENGVNVHGVDTTRQALVTFTKRFTLYDEEERRFLHIPFFAELKTRVAA